MTWPLSLVSFPWDNIKAGDEVIRPVSFQKHGGFVGEAEGEQNHLGQEQRPRIVIGFLGEMQEVFFLTPWTTNLKVNADDLMTSNNQNNNLFILNMPRIFALRRNIYDSCEESYKIEFSKWSKNKRCICRYRVNLRRCMYVICIVPWPGSRPKMERIRETCV